LTALATVIPAGCLRPPTPLGPAQFTVSRSPSEVMRVATQELTSSGFEITQAGSSAGSVVARRVRSPEGQGTDVACSFDHGSAAASGAESTMLVTVSAAPVRDGSKLQIKSVVRTDFSKLQGALAQQPANDLDCVTSGALEKRIADSLR
jgi:hypothetical protein